MGMDMDMHACMSTCARCARCIVLTGPTPCRVCLICPSQACPSLACPSWLAPLPPQPLPPAPHPTPPPGPHPHVLRNRQWGEPHPHGALRRCGAVRYGAEGTGPACASRPARLFPHLAGAAGMPGRVSQPRVMYASRLQPQREFPLAPPARATSLQRPTSNLQPPRQTWPTTPLATTPPSAWRATTRGDWPGSSGAHVHACMRTRIPMWLHMWIRWSVFMHSRARLLLSLLHRKPNRVTLPVPLQRAVQLCDGDPRCTRSIHHAWG